MSDVSAVEIQDLVIEYKGRRAVEGLSMTVRQGEIFGFLGPNGAGKSSTIKAMLGLLFPKSGNIRLYGFDPVDPKARALVGFLPEETTYYRFLSPVETLTFYGKLFGIPKRELKERIAKLLELVGLSDVKNRMISTFSKGMTQKMSLAQALINDPKTLILDEPTSGLDPIARMNLRRLMLDLKRSGKTIFFSSHELSEAEMICDSIAILNAGRLVRAGSLSDVLGQKQVLNLEQFFLKTIEGDAS